MRVITIAAAYGSGGGQIGAMLAQRLGIPLYDGALCAEAAARSGLHAACLAEEDESRLFDHGLDYPFLGAELPLNDRLFLARAETVRDLAERGPCVIVGCGGSYLLAARTDALHVLIHADAETRAVRLAEQRGIPPKEAARAIRRADKKRAAYVKAYTDRNFGAACNYHLCVDSGALGPEVAAELIRAAYEAREE